MKRRSFLPAAGAAALALSAAPPLPAASLKGNIKQGACRWCYNKIPIEDFAKGCADIGLTCVDLANPNEWPVLKQYGLIPTMVGGPTTIRDGLNRKEDHAKFTEKMGPMIRAAKAAGAPHVIVFSGERKGMPDDQGLENCVAGIKQMLPLAEETGVQIVMELLNSKVNHPDYMCDTSKWGVQLCKEVNHPLFGLLYDIYHMQIMEGDVIRTVKENHKYYFHYHTGGNPGRNELDETQELYYPAITRAIIETGFKGYFSHEFVPKRDPMTSLREATVLCDV